MSRLSQFVPIDCFQKVTIKEKALVIATRVFYCLHFLQQPAAG
jgi:hypothetical protein